MVQNFRSQFQTLGNNIAHYAQKGYNALSQGFDGGQFRRGLRGFKEGWTTQTYIEREGYSRDYVQNYSRNHDADILDLQNKQNEWLKNIKRYKSNKPRAYKRCARLTRLLPAARGKTQQHLSRITSLRQRRRLNKRRLVRRRWLHVKQRQSVSVKRRRKIKTLKLLSRLNKPSPMLSSSRTTADTLTKISHTRILCVSNMILSRRVSMSR